MDRYEIRVAGHLGRRRAHSLGCEELWLLADGDSLLVFAAVDQAAVYGLLARMRDAGLEFVAAERVPASPGLVNGEARANTPAKEVPGVADRRLDDHG
jgi:hypothetical protein